ncbi:DEAD/DEAH box helicase [Salinicola sp. LHM]|uniref:DEAD/DEAH box helicase n=1 Tax=Salinicola TaxID=404432 RepID=UPI0008DC8A3F|nr:MULTISPECIES: DEAD/DEAH box helicase [Salinicola]MDF3918574.1 DEAD/DEAH box helicase [Salinicola salarius]MED5501225.1 DEAD/DEAH box helicase [Pseudomonadota bacterium]OHZ04916.1 ATP-dependent RNA helicase [Salinicola sp. MIT1003]WQH32262.1 DEAD/DEAH box helicase [Salinicola sp. LHM]
MSFASLGLSAPLLKAVAEQGYDTPSPIQSQAIPAVLEGRDVMAAAQTGTGKTAGFTLPILHRLSQGERPQGGSQIPVRALILTPTRELAAQVGESVATYGKHLPLKSAVVFGGVKINPQIATLRQGVDILVATPGRLLDLHQQKVVRFDKLEVLVLDEADRMLDMGFIHDIRKILAVLPKQRQNLLFSATFSNDIRNLAKGLVNDPVELSVTPRNAAAATVKQWVHPVDKSRKPALLSHLIQTHQWQQVLVFTRTKHGANRLTKYLEGQGIEAAAIHGNKSQNARTKALADFKSGSVRALIATDIAARGLDIDQLPQVVNFELPNVAEDYVHRIGRTGRAGASGQAVSLVSLDEKKELAGIERLISQRLNSEAVEGFEPTPGGGPKVDDNEGRQPRGGQRRGNGGGRGNNAGGRGNGGGRGSSSGQRSGASGNRSEGNRGDSGNRNGDAPARRRRRSQGGQRRSGGGTPNGNV